MSMVAINMKHSHISKLTVITCMAKDKKVTKVLQVDPGD